MNKGLDFLYFEFAYLDIPATLRRIETKRQFYSEPIVYRGFFCNLFIELCIGAGIQCTDYTYHASDH